MRRLEIFVFPALILFVGPYSTIDAAPARAASAQTPTCSSSVRNDFAAGKPYLLNDPHSGLSLYVESDGRHIAAITREGKLVWVHDFLSEGRVPFIPPPEIVGVKQPPWDPRPLIAASRIGAISVLSNCETGNADAMNSERGHVWREHYISLTFTSGQFGLLDAKTGDFEPAGQN